MLGTCRNTACVVHSQSNTYRKSTLIAHIKSCIHACMIINNIQLSTPTHGQKGIYHGKEHNKKAFNRQRCGRYATDQSIMRLCTHSR